MSDHRPITGPELEQLKQFWLEEDERNGGVSDTTRCILEIEKGKALLGEVFSALIGAKLIASGDCGDEMLTLVDRIRKSISAP